MASLETKAADIESALQENISRETLESALCPVSSDILSIKADMGTFGSKAAEIEDRLETVQHAVAERVCIDKVEALHSDINRQVQNLQEKVESAVETSKRAATCAQLEVFSRGVEEQLDGMKRSVDTANSSLELAISQEMLEAALSPMSA